MFRNIRYSCLRQVHGKFLYNSKFDLTAKSLVTNSVITTRVHCSFTTGNKIGGFLFASQDNRSLQKWDLLFIVFHTIYKWKQGMWLSVCFPGRRALPNWALLLKESICFLEDNFFNVRVGPHLDLMQNWKGICFLWKRIQLSELSVHRNGMGQKRCKNINNNKRIDNIFPWKFSHSP